MYTPASLFVGLRYTRAERRNHFISFISLTSMLGVALGVAALITVLSVMNGFEEELRSRILGMTAHATVLERGRELRDWEAFIDTLKAQPRVTGAAPFIRKEGMITHRGNVNGALIRGVLPERESEVSVVAQRMVAGSLDRLEGGAYRIVLGRSLANALLASVGDRVTLIAPQPTTTPAGIVPRLRRFEVVGIFEIGMHEYDSGLALIHMDDAARLFRFDEGVSGIRLETDDVFQAPAIAREIVRNLRIEEWPGAFGVVDWTQYHSNFFRALKTEKTVMFVILALIVAVAAFNIVSTLVMVVADKRAEVAIMRTLGMNRRAVMVVFIVQGAVIGLVGTLLGVLGGVSLALNVESIVPAIESLIGRDFLPADVYYISDVPSDLHVDDVLRISLLAFVLCLVATLYPAWQAAQTHPADALRYE
ncbi:MAG: lipoprotein-releasing ABC transporter permease subunit [Gammaproteobacteria bacterium]|nr:lipoprotein-releasing ABC transporter permease subunit [Gammaproteobacteria bacterium]NNL99931.1 lipoprotein-releasing ABC transporter permease subunit [Gammaproteobacteria bacterium]